MKPHAKCFCRHWGLLLLLIGAHLTTGCATRRLVSVPSSTPQMTAQNHDRADHEQAEPSNLFWAQRAYPDGYIPSERIRLAREHSRSATTQTTSSGSNNSKFVGPQPIQSPQAYRTPFYNNFAFSTSAHIESLALDPRDSNVIY